MLGCNPILSEKQKELENRVNAIIWRLRQVELLADGLPQHWIEGYGEKFADGVADLKRLLEEVTE